MSSQGVLGSMDASKPIVDHLEMDEVREPATHDQKGRDEKSWDDIVRDAKQATQREHSLKLLDALRLYPRAVAWSVFVSAACVMEGYDTAFVPSLFALKAFQRDFGVPYKDGKQITAPWQTGLSLSGKVGIIIGILLNGYLAEKYGMKRLMLVCYVLISAFTFILVFGQSLPVLLVGEILCGIPWGIFNTTAPAYASEVCPMVLRGYLTTFINLTWIIGQLISAGVLRGTSTMMSRWAYDIPFALQWAWPVPLFVGMLFCPESPWWLLRQDRLEEAEQSLKRLSSDQTDTKATLAMMIHTDRMERETETGSYVDCFRGVDLRRTEIAAITWALPIFSGLPLQPFNTYFFEQAGLPNTIAFDMTIAFYGVGLCGTLGSWFLITWFGRRSICLAGLSIMTVVLLVMGCVGFAPSSNGGSKWATSAMLVVWVCLYDISIGPLAFCIVSEVSATRLRGKTIAIGRNSFYFFYIIFNVATPYMLNPTQAGWKGKTGLLFAGTCFLSVIWVYFRLPELKGRTYEELDILFRKRVPARKFKSTKIDPYSDELTEEVTSQA
ncbi:hypothetical protein H2204_000396 [Knufia peltigerae]|uniref:Major facilitator superfamily (MFS) profile domain-containing protein n=1 Tax=Knufia peltigerae TaxID=1002370 RepID=A0AA38YEV4_9EURO|nr:hypothetical protein H2204_000396 [Knufia peltigerae]